MLNQVQIIGNLGRDPESRSFTNGGKVVNLNVAVTEKWKTKQGEQKERTEWVTVALFGEGLANVAERYLRKGSKVFVQGKMQTRKWQDQSGNDRYSTEVVLQGFDAKLVMLDGPSGGNERQQSNRQDSGRSQGYGGGGQQFRDDDLGDDVPFLTMDDPLPKRRL